MRAMLAPILLLLLSVVSVWAMHALLGEPQCENEPLFTIKATALDCGTR